MTTSLPAYDDLPVIEKIGLRHSWDVFGRDDDLGTINLLTPERRLDAVATVRHGRVVNLSLPLTEPSPTLFGRKALSHDIYGLDRNALDDSLDSFFLQASSQWDGLRHVRAREYGFYTGVTGEMKPGPGRLGIEHWVRHGLVGRGVLLDIAGWYEETGQDWDPLGRQAVEAEDLAAVAAHQGVEIRTGDMLCLHFGWVEAYLKLDRAGRTAYAANVQHSGLSGSEDMARLLWNWHIAALACDNPAVEVTPGDPAVGSLHRRVLPLMGMALGEMLDYSELTQLLRDEGRWDFMMTAVPLYLPGGVGSPANAIAIL